MAVTSSEHKERANNSSGVDPSTGLVNDWTSNVGSADNAFVQNEAREKNNYFNETLSPEYMNQLNGYSIQNGYRQLAPTPTAAPAAQAVGANINQDQQAQFRNQQMGLADVLRAQAAGQGPSLAQSQYDRNTQQAIRQQNSQAASMRGINPALAARLSGQNIAGIQQDAAANSAAIRAQEQMAAQSQLGQLVGQGRQADIGLATDQAQLQQAAGLQNAQLGTQTNLANLQSALTAQSQKDQSQKDWSVLDAAVRQQQRQGSQDYARLKSAEAMNILNTTAGANAANQQMIGQLVGGGVGAAGSLLGGLLTSRLGGSK